MRASFIVLASVFIASSAWAADNWRPYNYLNYAFAINFPASPKSESGTIEGPSGVQLPAHFYSLKQDPNLFKVTIADFSKTKMEEKGVIDYAMDLLKETGEITLDIPTRVDAVDGRQISIAGNDGTHSSVGLFYYQHRLYLVQGTTSDPGSSDPTRFQQSVHFTNNASRQFGLDSPFGATGRF